MYSIFQHVAIACRGGPALMVDDAHDAVSIRPLAKKKADIVMHSAYLDTA
jgi:hypothetical protein